MRLGAVESVRQEIAATIDTLKIAVHKNHANFLAGRSCWSYEYRILIEERTKICQRQRQHIQEIYGRLNRHLKHLNHVDNEAAFQAKIAQQDDNFYQRFHRLAQHLLAPETFALLTQGAHNTEDKA
jgi:hypothetical protein